MQLLKVCMGFVQIKVGAVAANLFTEGRGRVYEVHFQGKNQVNSTGKNCVCCSSLAPMEEERNPRISSRKSQTKIQRFHQLVQDIMTLTQRSNWKEDTDGDKANLSENWIAPRIG